MLVIGSNDATYCCVPFKASKPGTTMNTTLAKNSSARNVSGSIILNGKSFDCGTPVSSLEPPLLCGGWTAALFRVCQSLSLAHQASEGLPLLPVGCLSSFCVGCTFPLESSVVLPSITRLQDASDQRWMIIKIDISGSWACLLVRLSQASPSQLPPLPLNKRLLPAAHPWRDPGSERHERILKLEKSGSVYYYTAMTSQTWHTRLWLFAWFLPASLSSFKQ